MTQIERKVTIFTDPRDGESFATSSPIVVSNDTDYYIPQNLSEVFDAMLVSRRYSGEIGVKEALPVSEREAEFNDITGDYTRFTLDIPDALKKDFKDSMAGLVHEYYLKISVGKSPEEVISEIKNQLKSS